MKIPMAGLPQAWVAPFGCGPGAAARHQGPGRPRGRVVEEGKMFQEIMPAIGKFSWRSRKSHKSCKSHKSHKSRKHKRCGCN